MPFREEGYTYVFEGLCPDLRIVVNYKNRQELILLAIINNDTGEEFSPEQLQYVGRCTQFTTPELSDMLMKEVVHSTGITETQVADNGNIESKVVNEEGFVLTWYRPGQTPFRLKLKFIEYLRLYRLVTNVSPKHIWEVLRDGLTSEMDEYINNSTPGFAKFVQKWAKAMTAEYKRLATEATIRYVTVKETVRVKVGQRPYENLGTERKAWALEFQRPENKEFASILFAMLDGKNIEPIIWKQIKPMTKDANPLVNGFAY